MKNNYVIPIITTVVIGVLFFFPSPESSFPKYVGTALIVITTIILFKQKYTKKQSIIKDEIEL